MTHPTKRLRAPDGTRAEIDVMLVPLIKALWAAGYDTIGSCQDLGESSGRAAERHGVYWKGYALLEMPVADTLRFLDAAADSPLIDRLMLHWAEPGAWEISLPIMPLSPFNDDSDAEIAPWAQIHFPNDQIDDLTKVITAG
jgi:hypothetical protein